MIKHLYYRLRIKYHGIMSDLELRNVNENGQLGHLKHYSKYREYLEKINGL